MIRRAVLWPLALCLSSLAPVYAASPWSVGAGVSTLGAGLMVGREVVPGRLRVEASIQGGDLDHGYDSGGGHTDGSVHLRSALLRADYAPFGGRFFVSAGVLYNATRIDLQQTASSGGYVVNGHTYSTQALSSVQGQGRYARWDPYLGVGWRGAALESSAWHWQIDAGVLDQGNATVNLHGVTTLGGAQQAALQHDLDAQQQALATSMNHLRWYPVLGVMVQYRF